MALIDILKAARSVFVCATMGIAVPIGPAIAADVPTYSASDPYEMAIIDVAQTEAERQMGRPLLLRVESLQHKDGWAFLYSNMIDENGDPLDLTGSRLEEAAREGGASRVFCALLKQTAGGWNIVDSCLGVTDMAWVGWDEKHHAPPDIMELQSID